MKNKYNTLDKELTDISLKYLAKDFDKEYELWMIQRRGEFTWDKLVKHFFVKSS